MANHCNGHDHGVLDTSMKIGFQTNLKDAIEDCGVHVPSSLCLWQYPELIRKNLAATTIGNINIKGKDIINISTSNENNELVYTLSTVYDTSDIDRPNYAKTNKNWGDEMNVKSVLTDLFTNILPEVKGIHSGDTVDTDGSGKETISWNNTLFNVYGTKQGLKPTSRYIRLYLTSQPEPIYIYMGSIDSGLANGYEIVDSPSTNIILDAETKVIKVDVSSIDKSQIDILN